MPERRIEAIEYECYRCGYKWISRIEKPKPRHCSKCKHPEWDYPRMSRQEKYLRNRLRRMDGEIKIGMFGNSYLVNSPICNQFLYTDPRPTEEELIYILSQYDDDVDFLIRVNWTDVEREKNEKFKEERCKEAMLEIIRKKQNENACIESLQGDEQKQK